MTLSPVERCAHGDCHSSAAMGQADRQRAVRGRVVASKSRRRMPSALSRTVGEKWPGRSCPGAPGTPGPNWGTPAIKYCCRLWLNVGNKSSPTERGWKTTGQGVGGDGDGTMERNIQVIPRTAMSAFGRTKSTATELRYLPTNRAESFEINVTSTRQRLC